MSRNSMRSHLSKCKGIQSGPGNLGVGKTGISTAIRTGGKAALFSAIERAAYDVFAIIPLQALAIHIHPSRLS
jgi:hypothetical protein